MQKAFPSQIEVWLMTRTIGGWGIKSVIPGPEEVEELRRYYTEKHQLTFPIAVWEGEKRPTSEGGVLPAPSPTWKAYHVLSTPQVVLIDQRGIVRQVFPHFFRNEEERAKQMINRLLREAQGSADRALAQ